MQLRREEKKKTLDFPSPSPGCDLESGMCLSNQSGKRKSCPSGARKSYKDKQKLLLQRGLQSRTPKSAGGQRSRVWKGWAGHCLWPQLGWSRHCSWDLFRVPLWNKDGWLQLLCFLAFQYQREDWWHVGNWVLCPPAFLCLMPAFTKEWKDRGGLDDF